MNRALRPHGTLAAALVLSFGAASVFGSPTPGSPSEEAPTALRLYPPSIDLTTKRDRQRLVVQAQYPSGITRDVTAEATFKFDADGVVRREGDTLYPAADGATKLEVSFETLTASAPLKVAQSTGERPISFKLDVVPVFSKSGCNTGSCHGAARGKDGFRLSLFGFDPDGDYHRLTREISGRRINTALPHDSLMLEKTSGRVPHTGGKLFEPEGELYDTLHRWLEAGAPADPGDVARPTGIEVYPDGGVLNGEGAKQQVVVRAKYSDGSTRDVTSLAKFSSNNDTSAVVTPTGLVTAGARGEAFVMARFDVFAVGIHFIVLPKDLEFAFPEVEPKNYVDELIHAKLRKLRIAPSGVASDEEFLRRAHIDIAGTLPTVAEHEAFIKNESPDKRERIVDELLSRKEFVELWVLKWAELLQIRSSNRVAYKPMLLYYNWLKEKLGNNVPIDQIVRELLSATGGTFRSPATNYYQNETDTLKVAENVAQVFMGMRIQCAQCHNHPFDRWTQNDYYGFAAFFARIGRKRAEDPRETIVFSRGGGEVRHPVGKRVMAPKFLGGATPDVKGKDRRAVLAEWITSKDNPYFARNLVNIVWAHFLGRGIIDEVDDVRVSNPAANPELLDRLAEKFIEYDYDFKRLVRDICTSRTYQLSIVANESNRSDRRNFARGSVRRIRAEVLLDVISQVTTTQNKFRGLPRGARAVQIADGRVSTYFLTTFGRARRETVCSCEVKMEPTLSQALHLLNGATVTTKIRRGKLIETRLAEKKKPLEIIEEIYIRCLVRRPTDEEKKRFAELLGGVKNPADILDDTFWAVLNSREFLFNH